MSEDRATQATRILQAIDTDGSRSSDELLPVLYAELRALARALMRREPPGQTLQPTALVHEAYLRLVRTSNPDWKSRGHFFGAASRAMRNILVDQARRKAAHRHGGHLRRVEAEEAVLPVDVPDEDLLALDAALSRLEKLDPRKARVVMLRYFAGLTVNETALAMDVSVRTIEREWAFARTLLHTWIHEPEPR